MDSTSCSLTFMFQILVLVFIVLCGLCAIRGFIRGPGQGAKPLALAFHEKLKQGALLSVVICHTALNLCSKILFLLAGFNSLGMLCSANLCLADISVQSF